MAHDRGYVSLYCSSSRGLCVPSGATETAGCEQTLHTCQVSWAEVAAKLRAEFWVGGGAIDFELVLGVGENLDPLVSWESNGGRDLVIQVDKGPLGT